MQVHVRLPSFAKFEQSEERMDTDAAWRTAGSQNFTHLPAPSQAPGRPAGAGVTSPPGSPTLRWVKDSLRQQETGTVFSVIHIKSTQKLTESKT